MGIHLGRDKPQSTEPNRPRMTLILILALQPVVVVLASAGWYRLGMRSGFTRGENHGIHYTISAIRDVLDEEADPGQRSH